jgi:acetoin utilization protein AcuC
MCKLGLALGKELLLYSFPRNHPMRSDRVKAFYHKLKGLKGYIPIDPELATEDVIGYFHDTEYIRFIKEMDDKGYGYLDFGDTPAFKGMYRASAYVVGTTVKLAKMIAEGKLDHGFNPMAGLHHARRGSAAGFCVFNDIAVAIEVLRKEAGINRILYVDIDAHHGDGVFYSYTRDPDLFVLDVHEKGIYPGTGYEHERGVGPAIGTKVNVPLLYGSGDEDLIDSLTSNLKFMEESKAEFVILQAGSDGLEEDPLTGLSYTIDGLRRAVKLIHKVAHKVANGKLLVLGGGGYDVNKVSEAWVEMVKELLICP